MTLAECLPSSPLLSRQLHRSTVYRCPAVLPHRSLSPTVGTRNTELKQFKQAVTCRYCSSMRLITMQCNAIKTVLYAPLLLESYEVRHIWPAKL